MKLKDYYKTRDDLYRRYQISYDEDLPRGLYQKLERIIWKVIKTYSKDPYTLNINTINVLVSIIKSAESKDEIWICGRKLSDYYIIKGKKGVDRIEYIILPRKFTTYFAMDLKKNGYDIKDVNFATILVDEMDTQLQVYKLKEEDIYKGKEYWHVDPLLETPVDDFYLENYKEDAINQMKAILFFLRKLRNNEKIEIEI